MLHGPVASFESCPSCGFEFGFHDGDRGETYESYRDKWIAAGCTWWSKHDDKPLGWDPLSQLRRVQLRPVVKEQQSPASEGTKQVTLEEQLKLACTVYPWEAARLIETYLEGRPNGVPDRDWFSRLFTFTPQQLRDYISRSDNDGLAEQIQGRALDNRGIPNAYLIMQGDGYEVGWYDCERTQKRRHETLVDAASDYVLLFWGLPRADPPGE